ncbi:hypothetical protein MKW92_006376 [Papaver armeniacum]|nr:hypothetical protein MKW92_006376 [Papaver armeniacum]
MVVHSWFRTVLARRYHSSGLFSCKTRRFWNGRDLMTRSFPFINDAQTPVTLGLSQDSTLSLISSTVWRSPGTVGFCGLAKGDSALPVLDSDEDISEDVVVDALPCNDSRELKEHFNEVNTPAGKRKAKSNKKKSIVEFSKVDADLLPTVILVGRPNVGKSALFNRFIQRREALVYNTPDDHVTRDIREGIAKLGDLRFRVLDSAGLETTATSGSILDKTTGMTGNVLARSQFAMFLIDVRDGLQPLDFEVGSWLRKHASGIPTLLVMNKSESLDDHRGYLMSAAGEAYKLGYGDPIAISAETGLGMGDLYDSLRPLLEEYMLHVLNGMGGGISKTELLDSAVPREQLRHQVPKTRVVEDRVCNLEETVETLMNYLRYEWWWLSTSWISASNSEEHEKERCCSRGDSSHSAESVIDLTRFRPQTSYLEKRKSRSLSPVFVKVNILQVTKGIPFSLASIFPT